MGAPHFVDPSSPPKEPQGFLHGSDLDCYWVGSLDFNFSGNQGVFHQTHKKFNFLQRDQQPTSNLSAGDGKLSFQDFVAAAENEPSRRASFSLVVGWGGVEWGGVGVGVGWVCVYREPVFFGGTNKQSEFVFCGWNCGSVVCVLYLDMYIVMRACFVSFE